MTTSTVSSESRPRSVVKDESTVTCRSALSAPQYDAGERRADLGGIDLFKRLEYVQNPRSNVFRRKCRGGVRSERAQLQRCRPVRRRSDAGERSCATEEDVAEHYRLKQEPNDLSFLPPLTSVPQTRHVNSSGSQQLPQLQYAPIPLTSLRIFQLTMHSHSVRSPLASRQRQLAYSSSHLQTTH